MASANVLRTIFTYPISGLGPYTIAFDYLARKFVQVTLLGADRRLLTLGTDYRFVTTTAIQLLAPAPSGYTQIEIRRFTDASDRLVDFQDGSILRAYDLNISQIQTMHIAEEGRDVAGNTLGVDSAGNLDARLRRMVNLLDAQEPGDAVTFRQVIGWSDSALHQAEASAQSALEAKGFRDTAEVHKNSAAQSAAAALASQQAAKQSENASAGYANSANNSKISAAQSADSALNSQGAAHDSEVAAHNSELAAQVAEESAEASAALAKSYSDGLANAGNFLWRGNLPAAANLNTYGPSTNFTGIWSRSTNTNTTVANGFPEDNAQGILTVFAGGRYGCLQEYKVSTNGATYIRGLTGTWNGTDGPWSPWIPTGDKALTDIGLKTSNNIMSTVDWQNFNWTNGGHYQMDIQSGLNVPAPINSIVGTVGVDVVGLTGDPMSTSVVSWGLFYVTVYANNVNANTRRIFSVVYRGTLGSRSFTVVELLGDNKFGSTAGSVCQGNDSRLNSISGKIGGVFTSRINGNFQDFAYGKVSAGWNSVASSNQFCITEGATSTYYAYQDFYYSASTSYAWRIVIQGVPAGGRVFEFRDNGVFLAPNAIYAAGTQLTSDGRLKSNFEQVKYDLNDVDAIMPQYYDKAQPGSSDTTRELGIVAQKMEKKIPMLVSSIYWNEEYPDLLTVNYAGLSAWLVGYCKTLKDKVVSLEETINSLEKRLAALESSK